MAKDSERTSHAIRIASSGSVNPTTEAWDARRWRIDATTSQNGTTVPITIIHKDSPHSGCSPRGAPRSPELVPDKSDQGKLHHG